MNKRPDLCLLIHCLKEDNDETEKSIPQHYIKRSEITNLLVELKNNGYYFGFPSDKKEGRPHCVITFDDGYKNNDIFKDISINLGIPYLIFLSTFYISNRKPFIWDLVNKFKKPNWNYKTTNYIDFYNNFSSSEINELMDDSHRPFTFDELNKLSENSKVFFAPHTHSHRPIYGSYEKCFDEEIEKNIDALKKLQNTTFDDFSYPCGLFSNKSLKIAEKKFKRIYTIEGGKADFHSNIINRISLISPSYGGDLKKQIKNNLKWSFKIKRAYAKLMS